MIHRFVLLTIISGLMFALTGCGGGGGGGETTPVSTSPTTAILKLNILGIPSGTLIGGIQVTFTLPSGVSLATNPATGEIASGVVTISGVANGSFGAQSYDPNTRLVSVAIINATGFGNGEYMTITASIASGSTVTTSSFPAQATAVSVIDTLGNSLSGFTLPISVTLQ